MALLRALWFLIRLGLVAGAIGWLAGRQGTISIDAFSYQIDAPLGLVLAALAVFGLTLWFAVKLVSWILSLPARYKRSVALRGQDQGMKAIMQGLSALAAGDAGSLRKSAKIVPKLAANDHGLGLFMQAMADRMDGRDDKADAAFSRLMQKPDSAFLGMRALYQQADQTQNRTQALSLARQAYSLHPKQARVVAIRYREEIQAKQWETAKTLLHRLVRMKQIGKDKAAGDRAAMALAQITPQHSGEERLKLVRDALKTCPGHLPATLIWIDNLIEQGKGADAAKAVEKAWKTRPHPDLGRFWLAAIPKKYTRTQKSRLRWLQRLQKLHPDHGQTHVMAARFFMAEDLLDQAEEALNKAESAGGVEAEMLRLRAELAEKRGQGEAQIRHYLNAAAEILSEEGWVCRETGRFYREWQAFAPPHNSFNTIEWGTGLHDTRPSQALPLLG